MMWVPREVLVRRLVAAFATLGVAALGTTSIAASPAVARSARPAAHRSGPAPSQLEIVITSIKGRHVRVRVWTTRGTERRVVIDLRRGRTLLASERLASLGTRRRTVVLTVRRGVSMQGTFVVSISGHRS